MYGDYSGKDKPDKGHEGGSCNRTRCQAPSANWHNTRTDNWYCMDCRNDIQFDACNVKHWPTISRLPMFETREMMDAREKEERTISLAKSRNDAIKSHGYVERGDR